MGISNKKFKLFCSENKNPCRDKRTNKKINGNEISNNENSLWACVTFYLC